MRKVVDVSCVICGKTFTAKSITAKFCCVECRNEYNYRKWRDERYKEYLENGAEGVDYVIDQWNGLPTKRIYGVWMKKMHPDKTIEDYKREFPDAPIQCETDRVALTKNAGQYMKTEKYRKLFSEMFKGEKNPNHRSRTTEKERRCRSPFCDEFYEVHGGNKIEMLKKMCENREYNTRMEFYLNRGYDYEEALQMLKERQATFTLEKCISKYGEAEGRRVYDERQRKWSEKIEAQYRDGKFSKSPKHWKSSCFSKIEKYFISMLLGELGCDKEMCKTYLNKQLTLFDSIRKRRYYYDFCYGNKIIEFNGDYWHCNPQIYDKDYQHKLLHCTAQDVWDMNRIKHDFAKSNGYDVFVVWENDFRENAILVIEKCIKYLSE